MKEKRTLENILSSGFNHYLSQYSPISKSDFLGFCLFCIREVVIKGLYMIFFRADRKEFELILKETRTTLISGLMGKVFTCEVLRQQ